MGNDKEKNNEYSYVFKQPPLYLKKNIPTFHAADQQPHKMKYLVAQKLHIEAFWATIYTLYCIYMCASACVGGLGIATEDAANMFIYIT